MLQVDSHPRLDLIAFKTSFPVPLGKAVIPEWLEPLRHPGSDVPVQSNEQVKQEVRDLLRNSEFKPTGRNKPASEYLQRAAGEQGLPRINLAVDILNIVSFHSGLPISVVDFDRLEDPVSVGLAATGSHYVFNAGGQEIRVGGLLCLQDAGGPCANAVKDAQRTKTGEDTVRTLSLVWGTNGLPGRSAATAAWYRELLEKSGGTVEMIYPA